MSKSQKPLFYLGRHYDLKQGKTLDQPLLYDPAHLTTHAVVTGMTGSGKTGLCIGLLEEAALQGIPAIIVDPKGDLTNLLLHFPQLLPQDFEPWLDPEAAGRTGKDLPTLAQETAEQWKKGLAEWELGPQQLQALQDAVQYGIFTPGSTAGKPVNILTSFRNPELEWDENRELLREKIASMVTALLGLVGLSNIDPLRSREHILLSNIIEHAWSQHQPLDLTELILQTQTPPFNRLGAFPLENFFPEKDRQSLAVLLNNFLASPSFQTWMEGQPLDIPALIQTAEGRPRHSIFYLSHLSDGERMFFVSMLFSAIETWMRAQRGTSGLRLLVYFDEILGYLPPVANPPSRPIMLRMLKQARAFGVGLLLATQNPVDLDYKALSNAGTWMIGRLQTDQDKQRLLDGLQSAEGGVNRSEYDRLISALQKRVFLLHNVNQPKPQLFHTRWALNFLAGPLTRSQIPALNRLAEGDAYAPPPAAQARPAPGSPAPAPAASAAGKSAYSSTRPAFDSALGEYFLPADLGLEKALQAAGLRFSGATSEGIVYRPALLAQAQTRYLSQRYALELERRSAALLLSDKGGMVNWEELAWPEQDAASLKGQAQSQARFTHLPGWLNDARRVKTLKDSFLDWVYQSGTIRLRANETLKVYGSPDLSTAEFRERCGQAARQGLEAELKKLETSNSNKIEALKIKVERKQFEVKEQEELVSTRRIEEIGAHGELLLSVLGKRRRSVSTSLSKRRMTQQANTNLEKKRQELKVLQAQLQDLQQDWDAAKTETQDRWAQKVNDLSEIPMSPNKKDIYLELFGVLWLPYYLVQAGQEAQEVAAFSQAAG